MWNYTEKVMDYFLHPRNIGELPDADGVGEVGNIVCGDAMKLFVKLADDKKTIAEAKFQTFGCASAIASASALTEMLIGKTLEEASKLTNQDIADFLGELPEEKMHCSVMGMEAFQAALVDMHKRHPELDVPIIVEETGENRIVCQCFSVTEGKIREVIQKNHLTTVEQVTHYTKAGGGCGGCKDDIQAILDDVLGKAKAEKDAASCERAPADANTARAAKVPPTKFVRFELMIKLVYHFGAKTRKWEVEKIQRTNHVRLPPASVSAQLR